MKKNERIDWPKLINGLRASGMANKEIAKECGCSEGYMSQLGLGHKKEPGYHIGRRLVQLHLGRT